MVIQYMLLPGKPYLLGGEVELLGRIKYNDGLDKYRPPRLEALTGLAAEHRLSLLILWDANRLVSLLSIQTQQVFERPCLMISFSCWKSSPVAIRRVPVPWLLPIARTCRSLPWLATCAPRVSRE